MRIETLIAQEPDNRWWLYEMLLTLAPHLPGAGPLRDRVGPLHTLAERLDTGLQEQQACAPLVGLVGACSNVGRAATDRNMVVHLSSAPPECGRTARFRVSSEAGMSGASPLMVSGDELIAIARAMKEAQDSAQHLLPFTTERAAFDIPAAYAAAKLLHEARVREGARPVGRKIGFTNYNMWPRYGVRQPIWAYLYDRTVRTVGHDCICRIGHLVEPKIEPEIVVHFRTAPPRSGDPRAIVECIDWVAHAFEIVQSHFPGWTFQAADTIVDSALHGALLIGEPQQIDGLADNLIDAMESLEIDLYCDGAFRETGRGSDVLGSPLHAIAHLILVLADDPHAVGLQAGELVTTGTVTTAHSIQRGQTWRSEVRRIELPGLSVQIQA